MHRYRDWIPPKCVRPDHSIISGRGAEPPLFDHLVGGGQQRFRDGKAERLGGLEVDDEIIFGRLYDRQVRGSCTLENSTGVSSDLTTCLSG